MEREGYYDNYNETTAIFWDLFLQRVCSLTNESDTTSGQRINRFTSFWCLYSGHWAPLFGLKEVFANFSPSPHSLQFKMCFLVFQFCQYSSHLPFLLHIFVIPNLTLSAPCSLLLCPLLFSGIQFNLRHLAITRRLSQ